MPKPKTDVSVGNISLNLSDVGDWIYQNIWLCLLIALILLIFHILRPKGFGSDVLTYMTRKAELDARQLDDARALADMLSTRFGRSDPFLPFDKPRDSSQ